MAKKKLKEYLPKKKKKLLQLYVNEEFRDVLKLQLKKDKLTLTGWFDAAARRYLDESREK